MNVNDVFLCPVNSISHIPKSIEGEGLICELVEIAGKHYLKYRLSESEIENNYDQIFLKLKFICVGLSVATVGQFWAQDELLDAELNSLWTREKSIALEVDKEVLPTGKSPLTAKDVIIGEDIAAWIGQNYPRIFIYYTTGLFLLRASFSTEYLYADVLLNFYKIVELITYKRTNKKPKLDVILNDAKSLNLASVDESEIMDFCKIRSSDSAHDYNKVRGVSRKQAVECKMWVDELIQKDMIDRGDKPRYISEITESSTGAIIREKGIIDD